MQKGLALHKIAESIRNRFGITDENCDDINITVGVDTDSGSVKLHIKNTSKLFTIKPKRIGTNIKIKNRPYSVMNNYPGAVFDSNDYCFYTQEGAYIGPAFVSIQRNEPKILYSDNINDARITCSNNDVDAADMFTELDKHIK